MKKKRESSTRAPDIDEGVLQLLNSDERRAKNIEHAKSLIAAIDKAGDALLACKRELRLEVVQPGPDSAPVRSTSSWVHEVVRPAIVALRDLEGVVGASCAPVVLTTIPLHISEWLQTPARVAQNIFARLYSAQDLQVELERAEASLIHALQHKPGFRHSIEYWLQWPISSVGRLLALIGEHSGDEPHVQLELVRELLANLDATEPVARKRARGRPRVGTRDSDRRIFDAKTMGAHKYSDVARVLAMPERAVRLACDRHRKCLAAQRKSASRAASAA